MKSDVVIVGAGIAGLFAAREIAKNSDLSVFVIDQGHDINKRACPLIGTYKICTRCDPCDIICGIGGAGIFSGGTLNLSSEVGGNLNELVGHEEAQRLIDYVDRTFLEYGADGEAYTPSPEEVEEVKRKAVAIGARFLPVRQRVIGTDQAPKVIKNFKEDLVRSGVKFMFNRKVIHLRPNCVTLEDGQTIKAKYILAAPGRSGTEWLAKEVKRLGIQTSYQPVDIGVRVEAPSIIMEPIIKASRDPKFHIYSKTYDDFVRTFCVNHEGFVVQETYEDFVGVNGHSFIGKKSDNTNFALLVRVKLTEPLENPMLYAKTIAVQATTLGGGKPILQRLGDLVKGRRSTWDRIERSNVKPTLMNVTPGDIAMALPHRILTSIIEALDVLDKIIPGVNSPSTLIYAPEIKLPSIRIPVNKDLETPIENIFVAGDGAGLSRGIVAAAATGIIAARGILKKSGFASKVNI